MQGLSVGGLDATVRRVDALRPVWGRWRCGSGRRRRGFVEPIGGFEVEGRGVSSRSNNPCLDGGASPGLRTRADLGLRPQAPQWTRPRAVDAQETGGLFALGMR